MNRTDNAYEFVRLLCASFPRFPISPDTKNIYISKLKRFTLTSDQWNMVLDKIIANRPANQHGIPELHEIYPCISEVEITTGAHPAYGFAYFNHNNHAKVIKVKLVNGRWCSVKTGKTMPDAIPGNATDLDIHPDNPAPPDPREIPPREWVQDLINKTRMAMRSMK